MYKLYQLQSIDYKIPSKNVIVGVHLLSWWHVPNLVFKKADPQIKYCHVKQEKYTYTKTFEKLENVNIYSLTVIISFSLFIEYMSLLK